MNRISSFMRSNPAAFYLIVFLLMIVPALFLFQMAESESQVGMIILLGLVVLVNLIAVLPLNSR